jgi:hypothetical protein
MRLVRLLTYFIAASLLASHGSPTFSADHRHSQRAVGCHHVHLATRHQDAASDQQEDPGIAHVHQVADQVGSLCFDEVRLQSTVCVERADQIAPASMRLPPLLQPPRNA